jgi:hypothetical protein
MYVVTYALVGVAVLLLAGVLLAPPVRQPGPGALRRRLGPEFDHLVAQYHGDVPAAVREMRERLRRYADLPTRALPEELRESYATRWQDVLHRFPADPAGVTGEAEGLLRAIAEECGYPVRSALQVEDALSVHHPREARGARMLRAAARDAGAGVADPASLWYALTAATPLVEQLLGTHGTGHGRHAARRLTTVPPQRAPQRSGI